MNIQEQLKKMDALVSQGAMIDAVNQFFSEAATTSDFSGVTTAGKTQMVEKMQGFLDAIATVNGITHHNSMTDGNTSASEFTFDFAMKDGSSVLWHEIIKRNWDQEGKVISETYFKA